MLKFLGRLVLNKGAREAVQKARSKTGGKAGGKSERGSASDKVAAMQASGKGLMTPERAALIQNAMKVRSAKQTILANLSDEQRAQLVAEAMKRLMNEGGK